MKKISSLARLYVLNLITIFIVITVWHVITALGLIRPIFLPAPSIVAKSFWEFLINGIFFKAFIISFSRVMGATIIAVFFGLITGVLMGVSEKIEALLSPLTQPLRYLPVTALIPLLILWFGIGEIMKIAFLFIGIVFYFIPLVRNAIKNVSQEYIDVAKSFGAKKWIIIKHIYYPQSLPQIFDGLIIINGLGWTYIILAEIINAKEGIGYFINIAGRLQRSHEVFAGLILITLIALFSDRFLHYLRNKYFFW